MPFKPAPGALDLIRAFVNTWDADEGREDLADPAALAAWLREHDLLDDDDGATKGDLRHAIALREALRAILLHHDGLDLDPEAPPVLEEAARRARLSVSYDAHGTARTVALARGVDGALGRLLAIVAAAQQDGTWERLKVCPADDCQVAFYDRSRNRSAVWCDMGSCGNRAKVRSYRARHRAPGAP